MEVEEWGFKKERVSPSKGHPKVPLGRAGGPPELKNKGKKWFKMTPITKPRLPVTTSQKPAPALD